ncbi:MAG TPA: DUF1080 domain-containing protein [Verrucomicrobiales bacterium]|nr:DUF1080 domain-containing protein [Verrucomicrobiales bacterium]
MKLFSLTLALFGFLFAALTAAEEDEGWISLFDGKSLDGWKPNEENPDSFSVEEGLLKVSGPRSHLFYAGEINGASFKDFEFKAKVMTKPKANSGIYFHTAYQAQGWPAKGYECQVNSTHSDRRKTGSLYAIVDVLDDAPSKDGEWFDYYIKVEGKRVIIKINGEVKVDYTEPDSPERDGGMKDRLIDKGTIALQAHDPESTVFYKDIFIRPL